MLAVRSSVYLVATVVYSVGLSLKDAKKTRQRLIFPRHIDSNVIYENEADKRQFEYLRHTPHTNTTARV